MHNGLATQENKRKRRIIKDDRCEICGKESESGEHALFRCGHTGALREAMRQYWSLPDDEQFLLLTSENLLTFIDSLGMDGGARVLILLWRSWQVRNNLVHESEKLSVEGSVKFLKRYWSELCDIRHQRHAFDSKGKSPVSDTLLQQCGKGERVQEKWKPPDEGWIKINVDGAFDSTTNEGGLGIIIRDHLGVVLLSAWVYMRSGKDAEEMEAMACQRGLCLAADWCNQRAVLATDNSAIAGILKSRELRRTQLKFILEEALEAGDSLPS